jgi:hypothetical protein
MGDEDEDQTIRRYQGGEDLERYHHNPRRRTSFTRLPPPGPPPPPDLPVRNRPRQVIDQLRDPYDFTRSYDDHGDTDDQEEDDHDPDIYSNQRSEEVATRAGTPLFSAGPEERYELLTKLGQGNFGTVWKA